MPSDDSDRSSDALVADEPVDGGAQAAGRGAKREWNTPDWTANGESIVRAFLRSEGVDSLARLCQEKLTEDPFPGGSVARTLCYFGASFTAWNSGDCGNER